MQGLSDLLASEVVSRLVGVIDLRNQIAVHAIAGNRDGYRRVPFCDGDPRVLARYYRDLGIKQLYVADLDAIHGYPIQFDVIEQLCAEFGPHPLLLDIGWTGTESPEVKDQILRIADSNRQIRWIAATESMCDRDSLRKFSRLVPAERLLLGIDFLNQQAIGVHPMEDWMDAGLTVGVAGAVILDLASVGRMSGTATDEICKTVRQRAGEWALYSGGGVRSADDVARLSAAGCDWCLVATALHGIV